MRWLSFVSGVAFRIQVQVHVFRPRLVIVQDTEIISRLIVFRPQLEAETVLSADAHVQEA